MVPGHNVFGCTTRRDSRRGLSVGIAPVMRAPGSNLQAAGAVKSGGRASCFYRNEASGALMIQMDDADGLVEPTAEEENFANELVRDAIQGFDRLLSKADYEAILAYLVGDLLFTPEGRERLRRAMLDPTVDRSETVARVKEDAEAKSRSSSGRE